MSSYGNGPRSPNDPQPFAALALSLLATAVAVYDLMLLAIAATA